MIEDLVTSAAFAPFARRATYTPPDGGEAAEVRVVIDIGVDREDGTTAQMVRSDDYADFLLADAAGIEKGGFLTNVDGYPGKAWRLTSRQGDDDFVRRFRILQVAVDAGLEEELQMELG